MHTALAVVGNEIEKTVEEKKKKKIVNTHSEHICVPLERIHTTQQRSEVLHYTTIEPYSRLLFA